MERTDRVLLLDTRPTGPGHVDEPVASPRPRRRQLHVTVQSVAPNALAIARAIESAYPTRDAFIVLLTADILLHTAAALAFTLEQLGKPVLLVDAARTTTDLPDALEIAGHYEIPEVCIVRDHALLRATRTRQTTVVDHLTFTSDDPPLADLGPEIQIAWEHILAAPSRPLHITPIPLTTVALLHLADLSAAQLDDLLTTLQGAIVVGPLAPDHPPILHAAHTRGLVLVHITPTDLPTTRDEPRHPPQPHALPATTTGIHTIADITPEAAHAKLGYLLARYRDRDDVARLLHVDLRGELPTHPPNRFSFRERAFVASVTRALAEAGEGVTRLDVERALFPVLMCSAGGLGDTTALTRLLASGAHIDDTDYDGRTALHLAASEGRIAAIDLLIARGARIDAPDRWGATPLKNAVCQRQRAAVTLLRHHGAQLRGSFAADLCALAAAGDLETLGLWIEAGVDHRSADYDGRTALHIAAAEGRLDVVRLLLACGADPRVTDRWRSTPIHEARRAGHAPVADALAAHLATIT